MKRIWLRVRICYHRFLAKWIYHEHESTNWGRHTLKAAELFAELEYQPLLETPK